MQDPAEAPAPPPDNDPYLGRVLNDRYRILDVLGSGGVADVYRAHDQKTDRPVALKLLRMSIADVEEMRERFYREARALETLSHPGIVSLLDHGTMSDGVPFLVMELLLGRTLKQVLETDGGVSPSRAFGIVRQILRALAYAHGKGMLHRDLKPGNVFLEWRPDTTDHVKLLDFGFVRFQETGGAQLTRVGIAFGTPAYISPEQLEGESADERADLYAVSVILYELLTGRRPFEGEARDLLRAKVTSEAPALSEMSPELSFRPELEEVTRRSLSRDRSLRYRTADEYHAALAAVPQPAVEPRRASAVHAAPRPTKLPPAAWAALIVVTLLLCVVCLTWTFGGDDGEEPPPPAESAPSEPAPQGAARPDDPWRGELAPPLAEVRSLLGAGQPISDDQLHALRDHGRAHPDDARVWLLLGHVFAARGWRSDALARYEEAFRIDPAIHDEALLPNLIAFAGDPAVGERAARIVERRYGAAAIPGVEARLTAAGLAPGEAIRLRRLRAVLAGEATASP